MSINAGEIAKQFYEAFITKDGEKMASLYAKNATFSDEVFTGLVGPEVGAMWRMLCTRSKDLTITYEILNSLETTAQARWHATYTFSKTGRRVHNVVTSTMSISNGKIVDHRDHFSFWKWSSQAFGPLGVLLGWSPMMKNKVRGEAMRSLEKFMSKS
jgi:ketosteroid isomerase-like protein